MRKGFILTSVLGMLLMTSCSHDEITNLQHNAPIEFRTVLNRQTKAVSYTQSNLASFYVTAFDDVSSVAYINKEEYVHGASGTYKSAKKYYWPLSGDLHFYAYAPEATGTNGLDYVDELTFQVAPVSDTDNQVDFLYAMNSGNKANSAGGVVLNFRHTMSQIRIKVKNTDQDVEFNVTGWKIVNVDGDAVFTFDNSGNTNAQAQDSTNTFDYAMWSDNDDSYDASYFKSLANSCNVNSYKATWGELEGSAILIPQTAPMATAYSNSNLNGAYIAIQYEAVDAASSDELVPAGTWGCWPVDFNWEPGYRYTYTINLAEYGYRESGTDEPEPVWGAEVRFVDVTVDEWQPENGADVEVASKSYNPYLRMHTDDGMQTLYLVRAEGQQTETKLEYSLDEGANWSEVLFSEGGSNGISFGYDGIDVTDLLLRGKGFGGKGDFYNWVDIEYSRFEFENDNILVDCIGSVGALSDYDDPAAPLTTQGQFYELFYNCACLRTAPDLPSMTLTIGCYEYMFDCCTNLAAAPELPATVMVPWCYSGMFSGCSSLTIPPALPSTTLAESCYDYMFSGCTGLASAPALPATTLAEGCYYGMFSGCTDLASAPVLPAMTMTEQCYSYMFSGCTGLASAPALPAMTLAESCYNFMFSGCTALASAPALPAMTMAEQCYSYMFHECTNLTTPPTTLPAMTLAESCYDNMFYGCSRLATAPALPATTLAEKCYYYMFGECTLLTEGPLLPATDLRYECYTGMFMLCSNLSSVEMLGETYTPSGSEDIYAAFYDNSEPGNWLYGVADSGNLYRSKNMTWDRSRLGVPGNWLMGARGDK